MDLALVALMKIQNTFNKVRISFLTASLLGLSACSHGPTVQEYPDTANAPDELQKLDVDIHAALDAQDDVLSPRSYEHAQKALENAKDAKDSKDILHEVAQGRAYLNRANEYSATSRTNMEEVVAARKNAMLAGAPVLFKSDFTKADDNLKSVSNDVENGDISAAQSKRVALQAAYLDVELKAIKDNNLGQAREKVKQAKKEGASDYAARTLAQTERKISDTDAFIVANRHDTAQLKTRSNDTLASADHLLKITRASKSDKKSSGEDIALRSENEQTQVNNKQAEVEEKQIQVEAKQSQVDAKNDQLATKENELNDAKGDVAVLAVDRARLESDAAFNQSFEDARAQFTSDEAQVYKQGNKLTIRLKTLEFPVSKSTLRTDNFAVLAKVGKVIKGFGKSTVSVEGHTDSDGGKVLNDKLSIDRAEAVTAYLISTSTIDKADIKSVGFGFQKPLASNKTKAGKAENRRVDVVITPVDTKQM